MILEGEVEADADGERTRCGSATRMWTGVGSIHAFYNSSDGHGALAGDAVAAAARARTPIASTATGSTWRPASSLPPRQPARADTDFVSASSQRPRGAPWQSNCPRRSATAIEGPQFWHLATVNPDGSPQVTTIWVMSKDGNILVNTALGRKKPRNLEREPRVALSWVDPENGYHSASIQGASSTTTRATRPRPTSTRWRRSTWGSRRTRGGTRRAADHVRGRADARLPPGLRLANAGAPVP